jgi:parvulin-like peptidyl-prolyl isomerase
MRRGRHFTLLCALAVAASMVLAACGGGSNGTTAAAGDGKVGSLPAGVVAQVGAQKITATQLNRALEQQLAQMKLQNQTVPAQGTEAYATARRSALQNLVASRIYAIESAKCGAPCTVTPGEIQAQIDKVKRTSFGNSQAQFDDFLKRSKFTLADANALIRAQLQRQKIFASVTKPIRYTGAEALAYYRSHRKNYNNPELREARHILVATLPEAQRLRARLTDANFAELARANSIDPGSKASGGDLGIIVPGGFVPEFQKAVDTLKLREISQPVKTQFGYHLIEVTKITPPETLSFAKVKSSIIQTQLQLRRQAALTKWQADVYQGWRKRTVYSSRDLLPPPLPAAVTGVTITAGSTVPATNP